MPKKQFTHIPGQSFRLALQDVGDIFMNAPIGIYVFMPGSSVLDVNPALARMFGYESPQEMVDSLEDVGRQLYAGLTKGEEIIRYLEDHDEIPDYECSFVRRDGSQFWASNRVRAVRNEKGDIVNYQGFISDVTERRQADELLQEKEKTLQVIFNAVHESIVLVDTKGTVILSNKVGAERLGKTVQELLSTCLYDSFPPDVAKLRKEYYDRVVLTGEPVYFKDARLGRNFEQYCYPIFNEGNRISGVAIFARDITGRTRAEDALKESETKFRFLTEGMRDILWTLDLNFKTTYVSPSIEKVLGFTPEERVRQEAVDIMTPESFARIVDALARELEREQLGNVDLGRSLTIEVEFYHKDGHTVWTENVVSGIRDQDGVLVGIHGVSRDITERKLAETALKASEEKFHSLFDESKDAILLTAPDGVVLEANKAACEMFGMSVDAIKTAGRLGLVDWTDPRLEAGLDERFLMSKVAYAEITMLHANGEKIPVEITSSIFSDIGGQQKNNIIIRDITERKRAEEELKESVARLRKALDSIIHAVAVTVEARDPYTAGHQRRVADLARAIATEMNLPQDQIEGIHMAGIIHDLGKISIPAEILSKPTKLTEIELGLVKTHSQCGYNILKHIDFPWPIARMILEHHEYVDGSGYPNGLTGDKLLIESRILAVADVVEAMASHRPYRPALGIDAALEEIAKNRGVFYDTAVVDTCLRLFREKGYTLKE